jgi:hypothetical protein
VGKPKPLARGDLIRVTWVDILESANENTDSAKPMERCSYGLFWAQEIRGPVECLITTTTIDKDGPQQQGYCVYPIGCVIKTEVIKRHK